MENALNEQFMRDEVKKKMGERICDNYPTASNATRKSLHAA